MLKPFLEMRKFNVEPFCDTRKAKDDKGKEINVPYLPWVKCLTLLYENGAERVLYKPLQAPDGSYLFTSAPTENKDGRKGACYYVTVEVTIDDNTYLMPYPVMNGALVVYEDTLNQLRVSNAIQRAFVKCVAVFTGLGISLWEKDDETSDDKATPTDDPFYHNPLMVKAAVEQAMIAKVKTGMSGEELLAKLGISAKQYNSILTGLTNASWLLGALNRL